MPHVFLTIKVIVYVPGCKNVILGDIEPTVQAFVFVELLLLPRPVAVHNPLVLGVTVQ